MSPGRTGRGPGVASRGSRPVIPSGASRHQAVVGTLGRPRPPPGPGAVGRARSGTPAPRPRPPHTCVRAHAAACLGHPWAGGWRPSPAHARVSRAPLSHHHARLHAPDGQRCTPRRGSPPPRHGGSVRGENAAMFRLHGPASRATCGDRRRPRHRRALPDMAPCRPETRAGPVDHGATGHASHDRDHAGQHRPGPTCQQDQAAPGRDDHTWLRRPVPHVLLTLTRPVARSALARRHQNTRDHLRLRRSSEAWPALAVEPRCSGGRLGMVGVLQTWTRARRSHPHGHDRVAGGGLAAAGPWLASRPDVLVHVTPLAVSFRATCRAPRPKTARCPRVDASGWHKDGVGHGAPVGTGQAACNYLAPDSFRVAISHHRLRTRADDPVTVQDKASATDQVSIGTVTAEACLRRFLQHGLPDRCIHVRDDGFLSPGTRPVLTRRPARRGASTVATPTTGTPHAVNDPPHTREARRCPTCGRLLRRVETLPPKRRWPP